VLALREYAIAFHLAARRTSDCQLPADGADESVDDEKKPGEPTTQLFRDLPILKSRRQAPKRERDRSRWDRAVAVGGILQGLLDFQRVEDYELADVFAEVDVDAEGETMLAFHKGTLLSLAAAEPEGTSRRTRGTTTRAPRTNRSASRRSASTGTSRSRTSSSCTTSSGLKAARLEERRLSLRQSAPRWPPRRR
jgi:hypothetical protein